ncbi:MAG: hypothetical protein AVDCRST_MAG65-1789, partial [uncultured Solirubrobacteraceae bacterium]
AGEVATVRPDDLHADRQPLRRLAGRRHGARQQRQDQGAAPASPL